MQPNEPWAWDVAKKAKAKAADTRASCVLVAAKSVGNWLYAVQYSKQQAQELTIAELAKIAEGQMAQIHG